MYLWRKVPAVRIHANEPHLLCAVLIGSIADSPEVTGSASNVPSPTSGHSTITPGATSSSSSSSSSSLSSKTKSSSNSGAIAGGVVGGVAVVALIAGLVTWFTIRRRRRHAPSADYIGSQGSDMGVVPYPMDAARPKLYVRLFLLSLGHVKAYETVIDRIIVFPRTLPTQAHTRLRLLLRRSTRRTQVDRILALHRTCIPSERYTVAYQRSDGPNFVLHPSFLSARPSPIRKQSKLSACSFGILWLAVACGVPPVGHVP